MSSTEEELRAAIKRAYNPENEWDDFENAMVEITLNYGREQLEKLINKMNEEEYTIFGNEKPGVFRDGLDAGLTHHRRLTVQQLNNLSALTQQKGQDE